MRINTCEMDGQVLDWAVTKIEYARGAELGEPVKQWVLEQFDADHQGQPYSTDWLWGGEVIEREGICLCRHSNGDWHAILSCDLGDGERAQWCESTLAGAQRYVQYAYQVRLRRQRFSGPTPLIAAMRCYVGSQLGDEVEVPDALVERAGLPA